MGYGDDWLPRTCQDHPCGSRGTAAPIRDLAIEAIEYLDAHDLVTIPPLCRESWRIAMMSPSASS